MRVGAKFNVAWVTVYITLVGLFLVATRAIPAPQIGRVLFRRRGYSADLADIALDQGRCFVAPIPIYVVSDAEAVSGLQLLEDGALLGPAGAMHADIREQGGGRYSHWGPWIYFSSRDGSDPRSNGRKYSVRER